MLLMKLQSTEKCVDRVIEQTTAAGHNQVLGWVILRYAWHRTWFKVGAVTVNKAVKVKSKS